MEKKLYRSCDDRIIAGVAGGLAEYFEVDPVILRLVFLIALFSGFGVLAYILAWILIPENPKCKSGKNASDEIKDKAEQFANDVKSTVKKSKTDEDAKILLGVLILAIGVMLLIQTTIGPFVWRLFWPSILVIVGIYIIFKK